MGNQKIMAIVGATGAQGGGLARAILNDTDSEFAVRALTYRSGRMRCAQPVVAVFAQDIALIGSC